MAVCTHLDQIKLMEPAGPVAGCQVRHANHPIARSVEPGDDWSWCHVDAELPPRTSAGAGTAPSSTGVRSYDG